jgi:hypothetical protein
MSLHIKQLKVLGDSRVIIKHMVSRTSVADIHLMAIIDKIIMLCKKFEIVEWFHILSEHNGLVDERANQASQHQT